MTAASSGDELVDVVDEWCDVVGTATRRRMRAERLPHRVTYVVLLRGPDFGPTASVDNISLQTSDRLVVHQRAAWKDVYPSYWDLAFGGVCAAGEGWSVSAIRELREEAGVDATLLPLTATEYQDVDNHSFGRVFVARSNADVVCLDGEVVDVAEVTLGDLAAWGTGHSVCPDSLQVVLPAILNLVEPMA